MRIDKLEISNVMGVEHLELKAGKLNVIKGGNGTGKTSVLESIKVALGAGRDATLIRQGQKSGKVVVVFDDQTTLTRSIRPSGDEAKIAREDGSTQNAKPILDQLVQVFSLNPAKFLLADEKEQIQMIQRAIPQPLDFAAITAAVNGDWWMEELDERRPTDDILAAVEATIYKRRTEHNGALKDKRATVEQLSASLPVPDATDPRTELERVQAEMDSLQAADAKFVNAANRAELEAIKEIDTEYDRRIAELKNQLGSLELEKRTKRGDAQREAESARHGRMQQTAARRGELQTRRAELQAQVEAVAKAANTREVVDRLSAEASAVEAKSKRCTEMIEAVRGFRAKAAEEIPIKGLEIRDGALFVDGLPFHRVNTARKVQIAMQVARYGAGEIPVVCVDGLECLDSEMFEAFTAATAKWDVQLFVTRVTEGPLKIEAGPDFTLTSG